MHTHSNTPDDTKPDDDMATKVQAVLAPVSAIHAPMSQSLSPEKARGRLADKLAAIVAATALGLSILLSGLFFAGFVANDYHIFAITSAFVLSLSLGGFAIVPMAIIMILARKAYKTGGYKTLYLWVLFLALPWLGLSILCLISTPLPAWMCAVTVLFATILTLWGIISLILEFKLQRN